MSLQVFPSDDSDNNITFFRVEDGTPFLIIEPDSYEVVDGEIKILLDIDEERNEAYKLIEGEEHWKFSIR